MSVKEYEVTSEIHQQMKIDKNEKPRLSPQIAFKIDISEDLDKRQLQSTRLKDIKPKNKTVSYKHKEGTISKRKFHANITVPLYDKQSAIADVVSKFTFLYPDDSGELEMKINGVAETDEEGDFLVTRKCENNRKEDVLIIEHSYSTSLQLVGRQIWRGALLLGDLILHHGSSLLKGHTVLELGSGVGLTSIVAAMYAEEVLCTDIDAGGILDLIRANASRNCKLMKANFSVLGLDFFAKQWSAYLEAKLTNVTVVLVADVIYDNDVTEAFVNTLKKLLASVPPKTVYIALEKRYVFTVADLDSVAPCYEFFLECLQEAQARPPGSLWKVQQMAIDFPQYFNYERVKELVLWQISTE